MPKTKTTPAAEAPTAQPERPQLTEQQKKDAEEKQRLYALGELISMLSDLSVTELESIQTFGLIMSRDRGCTTPIESFFVRLIHRYESLDRNGEGLALKDIEWAMKELGNDNMTDAIETAYFLTDRYPRPEPEPASNQ